MIHKSKYLFSLLLFVSIKFVAQSKQSVLDYASSFSQQISIKNNTPKNLIVLDKTADLKNYAVNFREGGFVLLQAENEGFKVIGFSENGKFDIHNNPYLLGKEDKALYEDITDINPNVTSTTQANTQRVILTDVNPFMTDVWGGVNCIDANGNNVFATNYYTPNHCSPGCVAISTSQVMHYYQWPIIGVGNNVYSDLYNGTPIRHHGFFDNTNYDWANMLDIYMGVNSTLTEQQAAGRLLKDVGVALEMDYEVAGSTSNVTSVPFIYDNYFRYSSHYEVKAWTSFWATMYDNMQKHRPVSIAVEASANGSGHVVVANGYKEISGLPYYYVNWGWWNDNNINGWYHLEGWNTGQTGYNIIIGALFDALPEPQILTIVPNGTGLDFVVNWEVSNQLNWSEFTLQQKIDQGTWTDVATGITTKNYSIANPSGNVYQFRVKAKVDGVYYDNSWSEIEVYAVNGFYNGYGSFEGSQYAYARQTPDMDLDFSSDYTFETWVKVYPNNQSGDIIFDQRDGFALEITEATTSDYSVVFKNLMNSTNDLLSSTTGAKLQVGQWHHIAISKTGNTTKLYVDGSLRDTDTAGTFILSPSNYSLNFGEKYRSSYTNHIIADMDQLRFSNIGRYSSNFVPNRLLEFTLDPNTKAYFTFQNVHKVRLKDLAYNLSVIVKNEVGFVNWEFEYSPGLSTDDLVSFSNFVKIYPNPTTDTVNINFDESSHFQISDFKYSLFDNSGREVMNGILFNNFGQPFQINLHDLKTGIYILKITGETFTATNTIINH